MGWAVVRQAGTALPSVVVDGHARIIISPERCQWQASTVEHVTDRVVGPGVADGDGISNGVAPDLDPAVGQKPG